MWTKGNGPPRLCDSSPGSISVLFFCFCPARQNSPKLRKRCAARQAQPPLVGAVQPPMPIEVNGKASGGSRAGSAHSMPHWTPRTRIQEHAAAAERLQTPSGNTYRHQDQGHVIEGILWTTRSLNKAAYLSPHCRVALHDV